jgi:DNA-binding winged helix-turn-helix (wHTH) protein/Tol biopolymer transport system component
MAAISSSSTVRFGRFEVNLQSGELRHAGQKVKLQEQPFQVLATLLERPGEIVTRDELRSRLWPEDTFVDFDHGLNAAIKRLRDALGESADTPVFIETLARRGYRFIAPVNGSPSPSTAGIAATHPNKSIFSTRRIVVFCLASVVIAVLLWTAWRRVPSRPTGIIENKVTSNSSENTVSSAGISPDGKYLAYADNTGIYLKLIRTGETHPIPLPPNFSARVDDWFPDGAHLLVSREEQPGKASLWSISVFGGSPRYLADDASGGSVSPDGAHIAAFRRVELTTYDGLLGREVWVMRSDGTDPVRVAADKADGSQVGSPTWSPDGKRIAYLRTKSTYQARTGSVEINEWKSGRAETLFSDDHLSPAVHWLPDGRFIYALNLFYGSNQPGSTLWTFPLQQSGKIMGTPKQIGQGHGRVSHVTGSADGKALIFRSDNWSPNVYIGTLAADGAHVLAHKRLTLDESLNLPFSWTPDSKAVLFVSDRNSTIDIFKQASDERVAENVMTSKEQLSVPRMTSDGSEILYISTPKDSDLEIPSSIFAIPITGGTPRMVLKDVGIFNVQCAHLPSTVCLYSIKKGNTSETFLFDVRSGKSTAPSQIDPDCNWSLSPDGSQRAIVAKGPDEGTIRLRSTSTGETRDLVVKEWKGLKNLDWAADGKRLVVSWGNHERDSALLSVTLDGRASVLLRSNNYILYAIPSPDGRSLAIAEGSGTRNVWQIENF